MSEESQKRISLVVPCYNEAETLDAFLDAVRAIAADLGQYGWEFLFVDDGSTDGTEALLDRQAKDDPRVKTIPLSRNFGQQRAILAGLDHCNGDYVVVLDADLQDPPELIPRMIAALEEDADVVHAVRSDRSADSAVKRISAGCFYALMRRWVLPELVRNAGEFKAFNRPVLEALRRYPERVRFMRGFFATLGFRQTEIPFTRPKRTQGHSRFPFMAVVRLGRDAIVSNTVLPLRLALFLGVAVLALLPVYGAVCCYAHCYGGGLDAPWTMLSIGLSAAFFGVTMVFIGVLGEYLKCIILEVKQRPLYIMRGKRNL